MILGMICAVLACGNLQEQYKNGVLERKAVMQEVDLNTLLHHAILENSPDVIRFLLKNGVDVYYPDEHGMSPLTVAILNRRCEIVKMLLDYGAKPNLSAKWKGMEVFELAVMMKDPASASLLLDKGCNVDLRAPNGEHVFAKVVQLIPQENGLWFQIAKKMIPKLNFKPCPGHPIQLSVIHAMINSKQIGYALLETMLQNGYNINEPFCDRTFLAHAVECGADLETIRFITEKGADVSCGALSQAILRGNSDIVLYLLQQGARS